ncbi:class III signal peptide-containing protein [Candidatus Micrarchaeota archaeon]|nr:class III signal peptide-containing protein [Candidatus Micrarchaeota archaeon]
MENKGQAALEYLLLIGAAVLIAAVLIVVLSNLSHSSADTAGNKLHTFLHDL